MASEKHERLSFCLQNHPAPQLAQDAEEGEVKYNYIALIQGGLGPDVWDKEMKICAVDFRDASSQAAAQAEELGGQVVELNQNDWNAPIEGSITAIKRTLQRLDERVHSGYDFNTDPDRMTLEVGNALSGYKKD